jgi:hypothetical protein
MSDVRTVYARARAETAKLLGYGDDLDGLTAEQSTRLDIACALRIALDDQAAKLLRGESTDVSKLLSASEALGRLLPPAVLASPPPVNSPDPRQIMLETYLGMRRRGALAGQGYDGLKLTVERLQAELAAKDAQIAELEATLAVSVPLPPNAVKLSLRNDNPSPSTPASSPPASAAPAPPAPARLFVNGLGDIPQSVRDTRSPNEAWRNFVRIDWQG